MSPRQKLIVGSGALLLFLALAAFQGASTAAIARLLLGVGVVAGLGLWWSRRQLQASARFELPPRLRVVSRAGLSQRCSLALIEADGRSYLVAFGDGFAEIHREQRPVPSQARRPRQPSRRRGGSR